MGFREAILDVSCVISADSVVLHPELGGSSWRMRWVGYWELMEAVSDGTFFAEKRSHYGPRPVPHECVFLASRRVRHDAPRYSLYLLMSDFGC